MKKPRYVVGLVICASFVCAWSSLACGQDDLSDLVVELLNDPDKEMRALALEQIRTADPGEETTVKFAAMLEKVSSEAQVGLLSALAVRGDQAAATAVRKSLDSEEAPVRIAAIAALGKLGAAEDLPALVKTMSSDSDDEKAAARRSLVVLPGDDVSAAMAQAMSGASTSDRVALIEILTQRRARNTLPAIQEAAVASDAEVRRTAMVALGQLGDAESVPAMVQGVLKAERGRERDAAEKAVMLVCHREEDITKQAAPLLTAMDDLSKSDRTILLSTLGRVGGPAAREVIEQAISTPELHDAGLNAICNWPYALIAPRLLELARTEPDAKDRRSALRAMIRVAPFPDDRSDSLRLDVLRTAMAMCQEDADRLLVLERAKAVRTVETLRFVLPYIDQPKYAERACLTAVELAHHSGLREAHRDEFFPALDRVIATAADATVVDRAGRYQRGQTWVRP